MENMIRRIIDADNEAKALAESTLKEKEELNKSIAAETEKIYGKYMAEAEQTVKNNTAAEEKKSKQQWAEIESRHNSILIKLRADFERNQDKWVDEIVSRTLAE